MQAYGEMIMKDITVVYDKTPMPCTEELMALAYVSFNEFLKCSIVKSFYDGSKKHIKNRIMLAYVSGFTSGYHTNIMKDSHETTQNKN